MMDKQGIETEGRILARHFLKEDMTAGRGTEPAWSVGEERTYSGRVVLCASGYHSSPSWRTALKYAPGPVACIVEVSEPVARDTQKQVSAQRKLVVAANVRLELLTWAADCAERALNLERKAGREPDIRSWDAITVLRRYVAGDATKGEVKAAAYAAAAAAACTAADAAYAAAYAAYAAADAANAAYAAAADAAAYAINAANVGARKEEEIWQEQRLNELLDTRLTIPDGIVM